jgi:hypothetical protein
VSSSNASGASAPSLATSSERNARARADRSSTGAVIWAVRRAAWASDEAERLLISGWEPFSVDGQVVYLRRQTLAASP